MEYPSHEISQRRRRQQRQAIPAASRPQCHNTPSLRYCGFADFQRFDRVQSREPTRNKERKHMTLMPLLAEMSGNAHVGLAALGAALGVGLIGMKASEAVGRNPGAATKILVQSILAIAFAEAIVFYALFLVR